MALETKVNWFLDSEEKLAAFLAAWEGCTLSKEEWTHAAHVAAAACYTWERSPAEALPLLRERIRKFNEAVGGQNTEDAGYHETLTRFWSEVVGALVVSRRGGTRLEAARTAVQCFSSSRSMPMAFYTHDIMKDRIARREWVAPERWAEFEAALAEARAGQAISLPVGGAGLA